MNRHDNINRYIDLAVQNGKFIEPEYRNDVLPVVMDIVNVHNPGVVVKIGIGEGNSLSQITEKAKYLVALETSPFIIDRFKNKYGGTRNFARTNIINCDIETLPLNYYSADLMICQDYFDFLDIGTLLDEFSRCIQFEGLLLLGTVVLDNTDIDGVFDDLSRLINPAHNDYYLADDLVTMMNVKKFTLVKSNIFEYKRNLKEEVNFYGKLSGSDPADLWKSGESFVLNNLDVMKDIYGYSENEFTYKEKYMLSLFRKNRYEE